MKVVLIHPPQLISSTNAVSTVTMPPLGLAYLAGTLEATGHTVHVIDAVGEGLGKFRPFAPHHLHGLTDEQIVERVPADADVIGVGLMFSCTWPATRDLLKKLKAAHPTKRLVLGGEHVTALPHLCFLQSPIDIGVVGEGEDTLHELLTALETNASLMDVPGLVLPGPSRDVIRTAVRARIRSIDDIPLPAWRHFNLEGYLAFNQPHGASRGRFIPMLATRGCPYECTFCASASMWTQRWLPRTPKLVVDEMEEYVREYQVHDFQFEDLTAIVRGDWVEEFCNEIKRRGLKITWQLPSGTRSEAMTRELAALIHETGCHEFAYAPESGSDDTLRIIKKRVKLDRLYQSATDALDAGIRVGIFIILGFPHETRRQMLPTYGLIARMAWLGAHHVNVGAYSPQPNTALYHELVREGRIPPEPELDDTFFADLFGYLDLTEIRSWNARIGDRELTAMVIAAYALFFSVSFLRRPSRLWALFRDLFRAESQGKLGKYARSVWSTSKQLRAPTK
ncbi:MAG: B12-binding domain-containing radical SAM protein [Acidobacteria bacterium]|nr:B12-binding domain-containing radical SAM protein [Acidobacteriota bacterium]